jgi:hypothetical protein
MHHPSDIITSYNSTSAAMIGWRYSNNRRQWYQSSIFWDVNASGAPRQPPEFLMRDFVPGRLCPDLLPWRKLRSSSSSERSSSTSSFRSVGPRGIGSFPNNQNVRGRAASSSSYFSSLPQPKLEYLKQKAREPGKDRLLEKSREFSQLQALRCLRRLWMMRPGGEESVY